MANRLINTQPQKNLNIIIIIPAFNEPDLLCTLESIKNSQLPVCAIEVITLINQSSDVLPEISAQNVTTYQTAMQWSSANSTGNLTFFTCFVNNIDPGIAGVGYARKLAMDEAVSRFAQINNLNGIIVSLDADTIIDKNYLVAVNNAYKNKLTKSTISNFAHVTSPNAEINSAIEQYELYLRYFKYALKNTGFPYYQYTIGSCFTVKAQVYAAQGGMNRRQAGEDFYFLQKLFPLGGVKWLANEYVKPSSRPSNRVPFGTGASVNNILISKTYLVYNPAIFEHLKQFFDIIPSLYKQNTTSISQIYNTLPQTLKTFLNHDDFVENINIVNNNCASAQSFMHRFYSWFNTFKVIKFLNLMHVNYYQRINVFNAVKLWAQQTGNKKITGQNVGELLQSYKLIDNEELSGC